MGKTTGQKRARPPVSAPSFDELDAALAAVAGTIAGRLKTAVPMTPDGWTVDQYAAPPYVPKPDWTALGDVLKRVESHPVVAVPGDRWITFRLDGNGFSKLTKRFRKLGLFSRGFNEVMRDWMVTACESLMVFLGRHGCGFTQSDEMTVIVPASTVVCHSSTVEPHQYRGRVQKMVSVAAAHVTSVFMYEMLKYASSVGVDIDASLLPRFDCRMGSYATGADAVNLVLWRAADAGVNGVSDAVHHAESKHVTKHVGVPTGRKLAVLAEAGLLPLHPHQAHGTLIRWVERRGVGVNPLTGEEKPFVRTKLQGESVCVLSLFQKEGPAGILGMSEADVFLTGAA